MRYIDKWLSGLGLDYVIPKLEANGITTPKKLAQLTLRDMFEVVGVEDPEDRKKLYFLIQRLQSILNKSDNENGDDDAQHDLEPSLIRLNSNPVPSVQHKPMNDTEEDLRSLRRQKASETSPRSNDNEVETSSRRRSSSNPVAYNPPAMQKSSSIAQSDEPAKSSKEENRRISTNFKSTGQTKSLIPPSSFASKDEGSGKSNPPVTSMRGKPIQASLSRDSSPRQSSLDPKDRVTSSPIRRPSTSSDSRSVVSEASGIRPSSSSNALLSVAQKAAPLSYQAVDNPFDDSDDVSREVQSSNQAEIAYQDMAIRVVVRKRPMSKSEMTRGERDILEILPHGRVDVHEPKTKVDLTKFVETQGFLFDDAFDLDDDNYVIYTRTVKPLVNNIFNGGKATCFAYGQTGSGKTFTMMGVDGTSDNGKVGLYVHAARDIFGILQRSEYNMHQAFVSCFEIYGGKLFDLLHDRGLVKCLEDSKQQVQILGLTEHRVLTVDMLLDLMREAHNARSTGATGANAETSQSSRRTTNSFQRQFKEQPPKLTSAGKLTFIDLAGSERGKDTTDNSKQTRMEGAEINTSLLALKEVIRSLNRQHSHTPFRGSKLTQVLKDSFVGENTRSCMIACVSPSHINCEHTLNTLRYADRVKEHQVSSNGGAGATTPAEAESEEYMSDVASGARVDTRPSVSPVVPPPSLVAPVAVKPPVAPAINSRQSMGVSGKSQYAAAGALSRQTSHQTDEDSEPASKSSYNSRKSTGTVLKKVSSTDHSAGAPSSQSVSGKSKDTTRERDEIPPPPSQDDFNNTQVIQMTVNLLTTHKMSIADMVEVMKEEMQLVQDMENAEDRDSEGYVDRLEQLLNLKMQGITSLRKELQTFQGYRGNQRGPSGRSGSASDDLDDISVYSDEMLSVPGSLSLQQAVVKQQLSNLPTARSSTSSIRRNQLSRR